ncbi:protein of unknown function [Taphrina deformans PYCC 5710]|uniref:MADS-box domain-containing protein n=1 Tax=Taphrina deformans (strain PYCC 5710 / ATCC 11124 / CBS 356.35 / IMI 108563 / JCM 9778 / NBRC 8474) TaxID=1097556 RepID=R4XEE5_TAPDE|nr:protein of unknown function [Taphrina deformans PYCC 5710]|eukprot:CCG84207.1 protein of unknown function [Taphrina deformans PYCC 5710]
MGRKKIQIKAINDEKVRKVTFNRRRNGILKKAYELSILCDTQVVVLMYDQKQMCHVYSSEEGTNSHANLMEKYLTKDFCTVDPIRNYDTSPDLQLDNPAQAVWRCSREKVAVVNTYTVVPSTGTPQIPQGKPSGELDDDDEADGSEQLSVKSSRTYHTKNGLAKFGNAGLSTPALTDKSHSVKHGSTSPELQYGQLSPRRSPQQATRPGKPQQQQIYQMQQGLGISGSGYTSLSRPGEQFTPILYPPQPHHQGSYMWPSPNMLGTESYGMSAVPAVQRPSMLPNTGIQYANRQLQSQVHGYGTPQTQYAMSPMVAQPLLRQSPRKEQAHFNHYIYPPPAKASQPYYTAEECEGDNEDDDDDADESPRYVYEDPSQSPPIAATVPKKKAGSASGTPRTLPAPVPRPSRKTNTLKSGQSQFQVCIETPDLQAPPPPDRRITRSQSRSPAPKHPAPPTTTTLEVRESASLKAHIPIHLRGPSLLDEISFDPETGAPMMESGALASWLGSTPLSGASPGHSR